MKYTLEDKKYIENLLNKCIKIEHNNTIYFITSDNILRQLKYNRLYNDNKEIKYDLNHLTIKENLILEQILSAKIFSVNYDKIFLYFESIYYKRYYNYEILILINEILINIFNLNDYTTIYHRDTKKQKLIELIN